MIKQIILCNTTGSAANYSISLVPSGNAAGDDNRIMKALSVAANSIVLVDVTQVLATNDFISILQGTSSAIAITVTGIEKT